MKTKMQKLISLFLALVMVVGIVPMTALAAWDNVVFEGTKLGTEDYYNVISKKDWVLVPGAATETEMVLNNAQGTRRQVLHIIEVDPSNPDVSIVPGYYGIDKDLTQIANQTTSNLTDTAAYYEDVLGYNIVGGMNTDLTYASSAPRVLVYNGKDLRIGTPTNSMLCVYKDAQGKVTSTVSAYNAAVIDAGLADGTLLHAVPVSFGMVVKDGDLVSKTVKRGSDDAARSMVGVKEDGTLVFCMNDGRGANNSVGLSSYEEGEIMLALGCKWAANCDGGGSSTFLTKRAGEEEFTMRSAPCDGAQRATLHGIFVASNVAPTGVLDVINIESEYDYFAPFTTYNFGAEAIDTHGYAMDMPGDAAWVLSDTSFGTVDNGKFVSNGKKGEVKLQILSGGKVVGEKEITVADPTTFQLSATSTVMPYSTEEKVREITLPIVAQIGEAKVYYDLNAVSVTLSDAKAGILNGYRFTATTDQSIAGVNVTVTYIATGVKLTYAIEFGKGSEVIFDFEDGNVSDWMGFDEAKQWCIDHGVNNTIVGSDPLAGQFSSNVDGYTGLSTENNGGQVHGGKNALAWTIDNRMANFAQWTYNVLFNVGETVVLRDVASGKKATALGMWLYIPEGAAGIAFQSQLYYKQADGSFTHFQEHFTFRTADGTVKNLNSCKEEDIPENRWVYASIPLTAHDYVCTPIATLEGNNRTPSIIRTYIKPTLPAALTFYIDDITLDYSSAVDDRIPPVVSGVSYVPNDTLLALNNGATVQESTLSFAATVSDNEELDLNSGKILVDGVSVPCEIAGSALSSGEVTLAPGAHTLTLFVSDMLGNVTKVTRNFTVAGDSAITLSGHNDLGKAPEYDSVYYVDIKVSDLLSVKKLTTTLQLQNANTWELEGVKVAPGFMVETSYNDLSGLLEVTVQAVGDTASYALLTAGAEDTTLVSLPVRVWSFDTHNHVTGTKVTPEEQYKTGDCPTVTIACKVLSGEVEYTLGTSTFSGSILVNTNINDTITPWHTHDQELEILHQEATCDVDGFENRTYCASCGTVMDWGTTIPATGHEYEFVSGEFVCHCGHTYDISGTKLFKMNGKTYYAIAGKLVSGWQLIDNDYYYFDPVDFAAVDGVQTLDDGFTYTFKDLVLYEGELVKTSAGTRYRYAGKFVQNSWMSVGGKDYFFQWNTYAITGTTYLKLTNNNPYWYEFDQDGALVRAITSTGLFRYGGETYYLVDGASQRGLILAEDGFYYYFSSSTYKAVRNKTYTISDTNGLDVKAGAYTFMADGRMKEGLVFEENGDIRVYKEGKPIYAGLVKDKNGDFYYINSTKKAVKNVDQYISAAMSNGLLPAGTYSFMADGKMKNGIVTDPNGDIRFYVNSRAVYAGLVQDEEGNYYYFNSTKKAVRGCKYTIGEAMANGLLPGGTYEFAADGKIKFGLVTEENGDIRFYNEKSIPVYAGLVQDKEGNYYYVNSTKKAVKGCSYPITEAMTNGLLPAGTYQFASDGKLKIGLVTEENGDICFYKDGKPIYAGLVQDKEGNYYYINSSKKAVKDCQYPIGAAMTNGLLPAGIYTFNADGTLKLLNGIVEEGGELYYYENNTRVYAGLVQDKEGNYYYFNSTKKAVKDCSYYIGAAMANGLLPAGTYQFDANGRIVF